MITLTRHHIVLIRFSALGDVVMTAAAVRALQQCLPTAKVTWVTSPLTFSLLQGMEGVEFEVVDKPRSFADYRAFYQRFRERQFDVVLAMQANLRINLLYPALHAPIKIGFDRIRAREGQWMFCNQRIPFRDSHLVDSFLSFVEKLTGQPAQASWDLPVGVEDKEWALEQLAKFKSTPSLTLPQRERGQKPNNFKNTLTRACAVGESGQTNNNVKSSPTPALPRWEREHIESLCDAHSEPLVAIHPHASKAERNWLPERYAEVIRQLTSQLDACVVLTGGNAPHEMALCQQLAAIAPEHILNLCGKTSPKQLAALLGKVDVLIAPDTGAVHIARAMNTPVIGLYAVASPSLTGPYQRMEYCVNRYPHAVKQFLGKDAEHLPWNTRVHHADAMSLIEVDDVMLQLTRVLGA